MEAIVQEQLAALQAGQLEAQLLAEVKASLLNARLSALDSPQRLLNERLSAQLTHAGLSVAQWQTALAAVSVADVQRVAQRVHLQATYCLHGGVADAD
ncbi:hypothetical protein [Levilactobacillus namurensis]|uniref:hypothetical protein n=1 Tax=Levilactobacillus namurensis TaxID=380393 RepID=UPI00222E498A|nr:hypothetical protein [Levilactobacillus namurensis]MCW3778909.1 hypothetical protein [Levilactobacillus namurensis]MDT7018946.1 hypothetical protein [Levilactobacillus namurensis]WNN66439.1 hypothetical protein RIN67_04930 [Levilactobacillus namurensis]